MAMLLVAGKAARKVLHEAWREEASPELRPRSGEGVDAPVAIIRAW